MKSTFCFNIIWNKSLFYQLEIVKTSWKIKTSSRIINYKLNMNEALFGHNCWQCHFIVFKSSAAQSLSSSLAFCLCKADQQYLSCVQANSNHILSKQPKNKDYLRDDDIFFILRFIYTPKVNFQLFKIQFANKSKIWLHIYIEILYRTTCANFTSITSGFLRMKAKNMKILSKLMWRKAKSEFDTFKTTITLILLSVKTQKKLNEEKV